MALRATPNPSGGTDVTESFRLKDTLPLKVYWALLGWARGKTNRDGMRTTLERMKAELEEQEGAVLDADVKRYSISAVGEP